MGIPIEEFKRLDPVARVDALAKAFNSFADGPEKSATALALFGKAGAEQLRVFKAYEEAGGRQVILTQQQIELADAYKDRQGKLTATLKAYGSVAATEILPALNDLASVAKELVAEFVGVDSAGKKLAGESPVAEFAKSAADVFAFLADSVQGVGRVVQSLGVYFGSAGAAAAAVLSGEFQQARTIAEEARQDIDKVLSAELFSQRLARLRAAAAVAATPDPNQSGAETARLARRPRLEFDGAVGKPTKGGAAAQSEAQKYLETLQKAGEQTLKLTDYEKALNDVQAKRLTGLTPKLQAAILAQAQANDQARIAISLRDAEVAGLAARSKAEIDNLDALTKGNEELRKEIALIGLDELGILGVERARISSLRALKEEELARRAANGAADETLQVLEAEIVALRERERLIGEKIGRGIETRNEEAVSKAGDKASTALADSIEAGILDGYRKGSDLTEIFLQELKAQFAKTILRPLIQPVADAGNSLIADLISGAVSAFSGGGVGITTGDSPLSATGDLIRGRRAGGGDAHRNVGGALLVGENGPELFRPSTSGRVLPNSMLTGGQQPRTVIENHGARIQEQRQSNGDVRFIVDAAVREVDRRISSRTGSTAVALKSAGLSLNRGLARRGGA